MLFNRLIVQGRTPFGSQSDSISGAGIDTDFADYAAKRIKAQSLCFFIDGNRISGTLDGACAAEHAFVVNKGNLASDMWGKIPGRNRVEPRRRTTGQVSQDCG